MLAEQTEQRENWQIQGQLYHCIGQVARDVRMLRPVAAERSGGQKGVRETIEQGLPFV